MKMMHSSKINTKIHTYILLKSTGKAKILKPARENDSYRTIQLIAGFSSETTEMRSNERTIHKVRKENLSTKNSMYRRTVHKRKEK